MKYNEVNLTIDFGQVSVTNLINFVYQFLPKFLHLIGETTKNQQNAWKFSYGRTLRGNISHRLQNMNNWNLNQRKIKKKN